MIPVSFEEQLVPGTLEHTIHMVVEHEIDISIFDPKYNNDETGRRAYNPKSLLKTILLGYSRGMLGSRKIEQACHENIIFMALTCGQSPDHSTIAAFVSSMQGEILTIFQKILLVCDRLNLLGGTHLAIDGVKLRGNASKQLSGTFNELQKKKEKFETRLKKMLEEHIAYDQEGSFGDTYEKKIKKLNQSIEKIGRFLKENEPKPGKKKKENKSSITDNDSHLMMTSHGVVQGYNAQAMVDSKNQIIVHANSGDSGQDDEHLSMMIKGAKENLKAIGKNEKILEEAIILGDPNYNSPTNLTTCVEENLEAIFPDTRFRKTDPGKDQTTSKFSVNDFGFNDQEDTYTCPANKALTRKSDIKRKGKEYYRTYAAKESDCKCCQYQKQCLSKRTSKRRFLTVYYNKTVAEYARAMEAKLNTNDGRKLYGQRIAIVEPVFANIREQKRMDRFALRSKPKVNIQWFLFCIVHNLEKLANNGYASACMATIT
jgi:transposase